MLSSFVVYNSVATKILWRLEAIGWKSLNTSELHCLFIFYLVVKVIRCMKSGKIKKPGNWHSGLLKENQKRSVKRPQNQRKNVLPN